MPPFEAATGQRSPTLLSSCALAATAEEAMYRLRYERATQSSRIIALDERSASLVCALAEREWSGPARFLSYVTMVGVDGVEEPLADAWLQTCDSGETLLTTELETADLVVMVAGTDQGAEGASLIGDLCAERHIMTTGLIMAESGAVDATVSGLRPNAMVMVVSADEEDLFGILSALRV